MDWYYPVAVSFRVSSPDLVTMPRNGLPSGCYPLDPHYTAKPEHVQLKELKRSAKV